MTTQPAPVPISVELGEALIGDGEGNSSPVLVTQFATPQGMTVFFWDIESAEEFFHKGMKKVAEMKTKQRLVTPPKKRLVLPPSAEVQDHKARQDATEPEEEK